MCSIQEYDGVSGKLCDDFSEMLKLDSEIEEKLGHDDEELDEKKLQQQKENHDDESDEHDYDEDDDDFEFSFACTDRDGSPIFAEEIFSNGEIQPIFPLFNRGLLFTGEDDGDSEPTSDASSSSLRSPLRKIFVEKPSTSADCDEKPIGEFCVWTGKTILASPDACKKSNSTGFSKLWRFRDLLHRSSSDGKDAFVFLHHPSSKTSKPVQANEKVVLKSLHRNENVAKRNTIEARTERKVGGTGGKALASAHEKHYVRNRAMKEGDRRRSYLPYRQDLFGFFTNVNGLSRNVHPY